VQEARNEGERGERRGQDGRSEQAKISKEGQGERGCKKPNCKSQNIGKKQSIGELIHSIRNML
jgi:hypothetical protein